MARSIDTIQADIDRTRDQLAKTLEELSTRVDPKILAEDTRTKAINSLKDPKVQLVLGGIATGIVLLVAVSAASKRREKRQIKEIQRLLAAGR